ncbi:peptidylprolyl isomerase [Sphingomonas immobilis]|uniref:peptidylprolyl isomerase n=1 Tax=Sphingomonas immobilis TaxID=3063997 RepID=A0ABT8ZUI6_9SPHN|nr:peptidylprolyl isomerase [Sphingomonas sp. CA1-15]MDO7841242.1 peptidylprolyl isomerase [Sphingomonas sp. CA1-15]
MRGGLLAALLVAVASPVVAQAPASVASPTPAVALPRVALDTSAGRVVIEVESVKAPISAANFLKYVDQKKLDGVEFYRTVKVADRYGFVQFGVAGDPKRNLPPIKHEPTTETGLHHTEGTISLARLEPGSGRGEFTVSVGDQTRSLDAAPGVPADGLGYAAFGHVVEGMDVIIHIMDQPVSPTLTQRGAFKGEMPAAAVKVLTARRVKP